MTLPETDPLAGWLNRVEHARYWNIKVAGVRVQQIKNTAAVKTTKDLLTNQA
jgi:hypothetical protein